MVTLGCTQNKLENLNSDNILRGEYDVLDR